MDDLNALFADLKCMLKKYQPPFTERSAGVGDFHLWSLKPVVAFGRKRSEVYFAGLTVRKDFVGFYYMPVYAEEEMKAFFSPRLLSLLKGKACFHIKKLDPSLVSEIESVLQKGFEANQERGWV